MGSLTSRQNAAIEEADVSSNHAYKYPPRSGNYFGSHFIMGGERFDTPQPEAYLFGENADLNFLGSRPTAFPYPPPQANEPTKTLKSLVNIRKESVRFVKAPDNGTQVHGDGTSNKGNSFNIEFVFDSDAKCAVTIYYFCTEEVSANGATYVPRDPSLTSETYHYKKGINQSFSQNSHIFNPNLFSEDDLSYNPDKDVYPVVIHCVVDEGVEDCRQSHTTICVVDHHTDGTYVLRALKQKIFVDGLSYLLQEIYGIENKALNKPATDEETDDNGSECVICMSDTRDTLILPCRHLCLCNSCADSLRYQANNCPICRAPFRALLKIRAVQKSKSANVNHAQPQNLSDPSNEYIPQGYVPVSLIEALNGPPQCISRQTHDNEDTVDNEGSQNSEVDSKDPEKNVKSNVKDVEEPAMEKSNSNQTELHVTNLISKENGTIIKDSEDPLHDGKIVNENKYSKERTHSHQTTRDSVHVINEKNSTKQETTDQEDDSEAENLSPLLNSTDKKSTSPLHIDGVEESIDDTDTDADDGDCDVERKRNRPALSADGDGVVLAGAEDSDYYTPEDPHTTILSPLCPEKSKGGEKTTSKDPANSLGPAAALKETITPSLPDSPISGNSTSTRSSSDSYSSSSSTKQLLSSNPTNNSSRILEERSTNLDGPVAV